MISYLTNFNALIQPDTAWKVSVFGVILVRMRESPDQNNSKYDQFYAV